MAFRIACPRCQEPLEVPDYASGRVIQCPACGALSEAPTLPSPTPPRDAASEGLAALREIGASLWEQPLANSVLLLGLLGMISFPVPRLSMVLGLMVIGLWVLARPRGVLATVGGDRDDASSQDHRVLESKKMNAGMTMGAIGFVLSLLIEVFVV